MLAHIQRNVFRLVASGLIASLAGCQQMSFDWLGKKDRVPEEPLENLTPTEAPAAKSPARPLPSSGELAVEQGLLQPKDQYAVPQPKRNVYTVRKGETLFELSRRFYGDQQQWRRIYQANRNRIKDPQQIQAGMKLIIP